LKNLLLFVFLLTTASESLAQTAEADSLDRFVRKYEETWQLHDASHLASFFTDDSDMIIGIQPTIVGRAAIETWWDQYFSRIDGGRLVSVSIEAKRILSPTIALLNVHTTTGGTHSETNEAPGISQGAGNMGSNPRR